MTKQVRLWHDREEYRSLSKPFENLDEAKEHAEAFLRDVADLRKRYRMRDVLVAVEVSVINDGETVPARGARFFGDNTRISFLAGEVERKIAAALSVAVPEWDEEPKP